MLGSILLLASVTCMRDVHAPTGVSTKILYFESFLECASTCFKGSYLSMRKRSAVGERLFSVRTCRGRARLAIYISSGDARVWLGVTQRDGAHRYQQTLRRGCMQDGWRFCSDFYVFI